MLESDSNKFEVELTEPNEAYEVTFKAKKKGLVFSNTVKKVINTFSDNDTLEQSVSNLKIENDITTSSLIKCQDIFVMKDSTIDEEKMEQVISLAATKEKPNFEYTRR